ncbi:MAG: FAD-dependent oxidoreductase [Alphaproteobacteria bacterium]|nr:FAD-dependent oxidoreductase [Alphaproteobacteria bacterium]
MARAVIVGAGPAGITAAATLAARGVDVVLIEEGRRGGGQGYRAAPPGLDLPMRRLLGGDLAAWRRIQARFVALTMPMKGLHERFPGFAGQVEFRPGTLAWNIADSVVHTECAGTLDEIAYDALVLATGATDRIMPVPGWTLPGVYTLGGAQTALKDQGCLIGRQVVFCGASPLLYLAALQYARMAGAAGARVVGVLDTTPFAEKRRALPDLLAAPGLLLKGLGLLAALKVRGVPVRHGVRLSAFTGTDQGEGAGVDGVLYQDAAGRTQRIECDAVAFGFGLRPESQLAELAGAALRYDPTFRQWFPAQDADGRCAPKVYVAGDNCRIGGARAAEAAGLIAAHAALADLGLANGGTDTQLVAARRTLAAMERFQRGLARAFAWPHHWAAGMADETIVCRCENVTVGAVRGAVLDARGGERELNRVKAAVRCGMGRCQGRFCGNAAAEIVAAALGDAQAEPGRLRAQPPVKPLPVTAAPKEPVT